MHVRYLACLGLIAALAHHPRAHCETAAEPVKALLITGGCCHDYAYQSRALEEAPAGRGRIRWTVINEGGTGTRGRIKLYEDPQWAAGFDVVVHNECFADTGDADYIRSITAAHRAGVPAVVIHCAIHTYRAAGIDDWRQFLGVTSRRHEHQSRYRVKTVEPGHPVLAGFPDEWTAPMDELYVIEKLWPDATALATARSERTGEEHPVFWVNTFGKARVFGTTFGHSKETFADPVFLDTVLRGLFWACDRLMKEPTDQPVTTGSEAAKDEAAATRRYLYLSTPDGAQTEGRSGTGILVFDIDAGHKLVRRIEIPIFQEGLRGFTGSAATGCVYYSTTNRRLGCFDLEEEKVVWESTYPAGCDRSSITPDGKKIYVPTGWWYTGEDSGFLVINAENGELLKRLQVGPQAHNSITSLDGRYVYLGTTTMLSTFDTRTDELVRQVKEVGERGVFPFTVDAANRIAYVCLGGHVGFDVVDLEAGKVLGRVLAGKEPIAHRTHGAGLTPDGTELWISDQDGRKLFIFDATRKLPEPKGHVELSQGGHGWVCFSLDGKYAWCHTPDVFDAKTKKLAATLKDEKGNPVSSSKFIEVHFRGRKVVEMGNEFGLERKER